MTCRSLVAHSFRKALFGFADSSLDALVASGKSTEDLCQLTDEAMETYVDESGFLSEFGKAGEKLSRNNKARAERLFVALMSTILLSTSRRDQFCWKLEFYPRHYVLIIFLLSQNHRGIAKRQHS